MVNRRGRSHRLRQGHAGPYDDTPAPGAAALGSVDANACGDRIGSVDAHAHAIAVAIALVSPRRYCAHAHAIADAIAIAGHRVH